MELNKRVIREARPRLRDFERKFTRRENFLNKQNNKNVELGIDIGRIRLAKYVDEPCDVTCIEAQND